MNVSIYMCNIYSGKIATKHIDMEKTARLEDVEKTERLQQNTSVCFSTGKTGRVICPIAHPPRPVPPPLLHSCSIRPWR